MSDQPSSLTPSEQGDVGSHRSPVPKKSPGLFRAAQVRLPTQPGQALDLSEPGIEAAIEAADPGFSHARLGHGHKEAGSPPGRDRRPDAA